MSYNIPDEKFRVTKVINPSPIKKSSLLRKTKRGSKFKNLEKIVSQMEETDNQLLSFIERNLTNDLNESPSLQNKTKFADSDKITFYPQGRPFFIDAQDDLTPSLWFPKNSMFHCRSLKDFINFVKMGVLQTKFVKDYKESIALCRYCLSLLNLEEDDLFSSLLLDYLSYCHIPYEIISLKKRGSRNFQRLLEVLQKHVAEYKPEEARALFRDAFLASLDPKTTSSKNVFPDFLFTCLEVSTNKYPVESEINWIIQQKLSPEEISYILPVLPQNSPYQKMSLEFGMSALIKMFNAQPIPFKHITLESLVTLLKKNKHLIKTFPENNVYHILSILTFMFHSFSFYKEDLLEELISFINGIKHNFKRENNIAYFSLNEIATRLCLAIQVRLSSASR